MLFGASMSFLSVPIASSAIRSRSPALPGGVVTAAAGFSGLGVVSAGLTRGSALAIDSLTGLPAEGCPGQFAIRRAYSSASLRSDAALLSSATGIPPCLNRSRAIDSTLRLVSRNERRASALSRPAATRAKRTRRFKRSMSSSFASPASTSLSWLESTCSANLTRSAAASAGVDAAGAGLSGFGVVSAGLTRGSSLAIGSPSATPPVVSGKRIRPGGRFQTCRVWSSASIRLIWARVTSVKAPTPRLKRSRTSDSTSRLVLMKERKASAWSRPAAIRAPRTRLFQKGISASARLSSPARSRAS